MKGISLVVTVFTVLMLLQLQPSSAAENVYTRNVCGLLDYSCYGWNGDSFDFEELECWSAIEGYEVERMVFCKALRDVCASRGPVGDVKKKCMELLEDIPIDD